MLDFSRAALPHGGVRPFHQKTTCLTELTSGSCEAHIGSRYAQYLRQHNPRSPPCEICGGRAGRFHCLTQGLRHAIIRFRARILARMKRNKSFKKRFFKYFVTLLQVSLLDAGFEIGSSASVVIRHTLNPQSSTLIPEPQYLNPTPYTIHPESQTLSREPSTLNPHPSNLNPYPQPQTPYP